MPRWATAVGLGLLCARLAVAAHARPRRRLLDRRGDLGRDCSPSVDGDSAPAPPGRLTAALLPTAPHLDRLVRRQRARDTRAVAPACARVHPARVTGWPARSSAEPRGGSAPHSRRSIPYLTYYGQETRMYTFAAFFSLVATAAFVRGVIEGRRRWLPVLVVSLDLLLYTHNWGLFFCIGLAAATAAFARERWREAVAAGAAVRASVRAMGTDVAVPGAPHRRALGDASRRARAPARARVRVRDRRRVRRARACCCRRACAAPPRVCADGAARNRRGDDRRCLDRVAGFLDVDVALLRGAARSVAACRGCRARSRRQARDRCAARWRSSCGPATRCTTTSRTYARLPPLSRR